MNRRPTSGRSPDALIRPWQTLGSRLLLDRSPHLRVYDQTVRLPDGRVIDDWTRVWYPDYVIVAAVTVDGLMVATRSYRQGPRAVELGLPGGIVEPGEEPLAAAQRELREETGYAAESWTDLGGFCGDPNRGSGFGRYFLARGAYRVADPDHGDLEEIAVELTPVAELLAATRTGEVKSIQSAAGIALAAAALTC